MSGVFWTFWLHDFQSLRLFHEEIFLAVVHFLTLVENHTDLSQCRLCISYVNGIREVLIGCDLNATVHY